MIGIFAGVIEWDFKIQTENICFIKKNLKIFYTSAIRGRYWMRLCTVEEIWIKLLLCWKYTNIGLDFGCWNFDESMFLLSYEGILTWKRRKLLRHVQCAVITAIAKHACNPRYFFRQESHFLQSISSCFLSIVVLI